MKARDAMKMVNVIDVLSLMDIRQPTIQLERKDFLININILVAWIDHLNATSVTETAVILNKQFWVLLCFKWGLFALSDGLGIEKKKNDEVKWSEAKEDF